MSILFPIKRKIIYNAFLKRKAKKPFCVEADESYQLPPDAEDYENNSYFFGGHNVATGESLVMRLGLRNRATAEIFVFYRNKEMFLVTPQDEYDVKNLPLSCEEVEAGKSWNVRFDGKLQEKTTGVMHNVSFTLRFTARREIYDFYYSLQNPYMIDAIASVKWTKEFQENNAKNNQRHYEQSGYLEGEIEIDGAKSHIKLPGGRDHSFGRRVWSDMREHVWLFAMKENGEIFNYSLVDYPDLKNIQCGYCDFGKDKLVSLKKSRIDFYRYENGLGSDKMKLTLEMEDGDILHVETDREAYHRTNYDGGKFYFQEGIGTFTINGEKALGCIEYGFNQDPSVWETQRQKG